jgi:hypothetical protein
VWTPWPGSAWCADSIAQTTARLPISPDWIRGEISHNFCYFCLS